MKKSRSFSALLAALFVFLTFNAVIIPAEAAVSDGAVTPAASEFVYSCDNGEVTISDYSGKSVKINIPEKINGYPVTCITNDFSNNPNIEYIKIPSTVTTLFAGAFNLCSKLTYIDVDANNTTFKSVGGVLFSSDLKSLKIFPCGKSGAYTVPESVETISAYAFDHCYKITDINMFNYVKSIGNSAFSYCWNLKTIRLSNQLKTLGVKALAYCSNLKELHLPGSLTTIGSNALLGTLDSGSHKVYYFVNGIYCVGGTYAYDYVRALGIPEGKYLKVENSIEFAKGDLDGDGICTLNDVEIALESATGIAVLSSGQLRAGNIDNSADGKISTDDARRIFRYVSKVTKSL